MAALDLLGRRWALRILWELRGEPLSFRGLQQACGGISPTVLNARLAELRQAEIVESGEAGYALTPLGQGLVRALRPLASWSERWAHALGDAPAAAPPRRRRSRS